MYNVNVYVNTFAFSFKLILGENTFFMKYPWATASNYSESFLKILQKTPLKLEESLFLMMLQTLYLKHYKNTILASMFSYKFWAFWAFPLKTLCDYLWMGSIYSLKIPPKLSQKHVANVANMLKVISLTGTSHNLVRRFLECYWDMYFF